MTNIPQNQSVIVMTGMHRSGTSLTASLLQNAGISIGDRLMGVDTGNPKGHFEDLDFVEFHQNVLQSQGISIAGWTEHGFIEVQQQYVAPAQDLIRARQERAIWGWKDPRTTLFLNFWSELIPQAKFIFLFRSPWEVVDSLFRRGDIIFQTNPKFAVKQWCQYNQLILDFYERNPEKCLLIEISNIIKEQNLLIDLVKQKWDLELESSEPVYEPSLFTTGRDRKYRQALIAKFFPQAIELYDILNDRGDCSSLSVTTSLAPDATCQSWILQDWIDFKQTSAQSIHLQQQLASVNGELTQVKQQLESANAELTQTQQELNNYQIDLTQANQILESTTTELTKTQQQLQSINPELIKTQQKLQKTEHKFNEALQQAQVAQMQADQFKLLIVAMETSKFWKLRTWWLNFKQKNNMGGTDILYQNYLLSNNSQPVEEAVAIVKEAVAINVNSEHPTADTPQYSLWLQQKYPNAANLRKIQLKCQSFAYKPLISVVKPVYNPEAEFLREAIASVIEQVYVYWELCNADDCSSKHHVKEVLDEYAGKDVRIKVVYRSENGHICRSSNSAIEIATGELIALLDHDDLLAPHALARVIELLNQHPEADFIYSDEDKVDDNNVHQDHFFKPDWCPDSFLSRMYTCHLGVYRRSLVNEIGNFRVGFEGSQDYDLVLRITEKTDKIFHIPDILYHWRIHLESTAGGAEAKPYATNAAQKALEEAIARRQEPGKITLKNNVPGVYIVRYEIKEPKLVSIIIPTKDLADVINVCLESIFALTTYSNYEVIVIDNGSVEEKTQQCFDYWQRKESDRFKCYRYDVPFNYSHINNYGVSEAKGEYLLLLNNDTKVITPDWIEAMVEQAQRPSIGAVGSMLLYPDDTIQHAGVVLGLGGVAGHSHKHFPVSHPGYISQLASINNYSAVTGACLMCRREGYERAGGLDENLQVAFNDVDFCLKIVSHCYRYIHLTHVVLSHYQSKSRGYEDTPEKQARFSKEVQYMQKRWSTMFAKDPCYNPNL
ncbi:MAG: glycosyltransferase, partial [Pleurocapsa sp.]